MVDPIERNIEYVKSLKQAGVQLILHTNREGKILEAAVEACKSVGIEFDAINQNLQCRVDKWGESRKVGADLYFDDKAINSDKVSSWVDNWPEPTICERCGHPAITYEDHMTYRDVPIKTTHCPHCGRYLINHEEGVD